MIMSFACGVRRLGRWWRLVGVMSVLAWAATGAAGQTSLPPSAAATAMKAFAEARAMVDGWGTAAVVGGGEAGAFGGVSVQLRFGGEVWGRSSRWRMGVAGSRGAEEPGALVLAVRDALAQSDARIRSGNDALNDAKRAEAARGLALSVEVAGELTPMIPVPETLDELDRRLMPGVDGLAVRRGNVVEGVFPGTMTALNQTPSQSVRAAIARLTGDPALGVMPLKDVLEKEGLTICSFRALHVVQTGVGGEGAAARFVKRGGRVVGLGEIANKGALAEMGQQLADHLRTQRLSGGDLETGVLSAHLGRFEPGEQRGAGFASRMLAQAALARWSTVGASARPQAPLWHVEQVTTLAERATGLRGGAENGDKPGARVEPDRALAALMVMALSDGMRARGACSAETRAEAERIARMLIERTVPLTVGFAGADGPLAVFARVRSAGLGLGGLEAGAVRDEVAGVFAVAAEGQLVSTMPFLGWAAVECESRAGEGAAAVSALRRMRAEINEHQVRAGAAEDEQGDLAGGVSFTAASNPLPNWNTARALAITARMLGDDRYTTKEETAAETMRVMAGVRFLRQLMADESSAWMHPAPGLVKGGVRSAPWDQTMPLDATSMTLLAVCEAIEGIERAEKRMR